MFALAADRDDVFVSDYATLPPLSPGSLFVKLVLMMIEWCSFLACLIGLL